MTAFDSELLLPSGLSKYIKRNIEIAVFLYDDLSLKQLFSTTSNKGLGMRLYCSYLGIQKSGQTLTSCRRINSLKYIRIYR